MYVVSCLVVSNSLWPQAPLSMEFSRQLYWSRVPFPTPGDLPHPGSEPESPAAAVLQTDSLPLSHQGSANAGRQNVRT